MNFGGDSVSVACSIAITATRLESTSINCGNEIATVLLRRAEARITFRVTLNALPDRITRTEFTDGRLESSNRQQTVS